MCGFGVWETIVVEFLMFNGTDPEGERERKTEVELLFFPFSFKYKFHVFDQGCFTSPPSRNKRSLAVLFVVLSFGHGRSPDECVKCTCIPF